MDNINENKHNCLTIVEFHKLNWATWSDATASRGRMFPHQSQGVSSSGVRPHNDAGIYTRCRWWLTFRWQVNTVYEYGVTLYQERGSPPHKWPKRQHKVVASGGTLALPERWRWRNVKTSASQVGSAGERISFFGRENLFGYATDPKQACAASRPSMLIVIWGFVSSCLRCKPVVSLLSQFYSSIMGWKQGCRTVIVTHPQ